jgi:hypothetical protein
MSLAACDRGAPPAANSGQYGRIVTLAPNLLVFRLLLIWAVVIAAMTLYGWTR